MEQQPVKYKLQFPIDYLGNLVTEVELKRPKGKHIKNLDGKNPMADTLTLASKISGMPPAFFDEMDACDVTRVSEIISTFLSNGLEIGNSVSGS